MLLFKKVVGILVGWEEHPGFEKVGKESLGGQQFPCGKAQSRIAPSSPISRSRCRTCSSDTLRLIIESVSQRQHPPVLVGIRILIALCGHPFAQRHDAGHDAVNLLDGLLLVRLDISGMVGLDHR